MASSLDRELAQATQVGGVIFTVPANATVTVIGLRATNFDATDSHWIEIQHNTTYLSPGRLPLPISTGYEFIDGKTVMKAGDTLSATADADSVIDISISYLIQTTS